MLVPASAIKKLPNMFVGVLSSRKVSEEARLGGIFFIPCSDELLVTVDGVPVSTWQEVHVCQALEA